MYQVLVPFFSGNIYKSQWYGNWNSHYLHQHITGEQRPEGSTVFNSSPPWCCSRSHSSAGRTSRMPCCCCTAVAASTLLLQLLHGCCSCSFTDVAAATLLLLLLQHCYWWTVAAIAIEDDSPRHWNRRFEIPAINIKQDVKVQCRWSI